MRFTISRCPHCRKVIDLRTSRFSEGPLGRPSFSMCRLCGGRISNGQREWAEFSIWGRIGYFVWVAWSAIALGLMAAVPVFLVGQLLSWGMNTIGVLSIGAFGAVAFLYTVQTRTAILKSAERTSQAMKKEKAKLAAAPLINALSEELANVRTRFAALDSSLDPTERRLLIRAGFVAAYSSILALANRTPVLTQDEKWALRHLALDSMIRYTVDLSSKDLIPTNLPPRETAFLLSLPTDDLFDTLPKSFIGSVTGKSRKELLPVVVRAEETVSRSWTAANGQSTMPAIAAVAAAVAAELNITRHTSTLENLMQEVYRDAESSTSC